MVRSRNIVVAAIAAVVLFNLVALVATNSYVANRANAAEEFARETVESVPESFLTGGDRTLTSLTEINGALGETDRNSTGSPRDSTS
jgi:hypothetical protein